MGGPIESGIPSALNIFHYVLFMFYLCLIHDLPPSDAPSCPAEGAGLAPGQVEASSEAAERLQTRELIGL
jgi:hypothetical protein